MNPIHCALPLNELVILLHIQLKEPEELLNIWHTEQKRAGETEEEAIKSS